MSVQLVSGGSPLRTGCLLLGAVVLFGGLARGAYAEVRAATPNAPATITAAAVGQYYGWGLTDATFAGYCAKALAYHGGYPKGTCPDVDPVTQPSKTGQCGRFFNNSYCSPADAYYQLVCPANYAMQAGACKNTVTVYTCPAGQSWTLSGTTCTRPDCVAPEVRDPATGQCAIKCPTGQDWSASTGQCLCSL